ncbi:MAG TPA: MG2 domain-containing protein, partial [Pyrinomonadaceae bacterium]|nr:MG2 domain-containing protein [Pyrinomonadaceae bacterium]
PFSQLPRTNVEAFPWFRLHYRVAPVDGSAQPAAGVVSLSAAAPDLFELSVVTPRRARGGSTLRASARATNPVTRRPAAGVAVTAELEVEVGEDEEETTLKAAATTGADGLALLDFELPRGAADDVDLKVTARRGAFEQTAESYVSLEEEPRLLLTTDKPLYQPGQTMHMRALVLDAAGRAGAGEKVSFEVSDEEGSTAFEAEATTSRFGVASVDWAVPASARLGEYEIKLEADDDKYDGDADVRTRVRVSRYELPNFSVSAKGDRPFYLAGQDAEVEVRADYLFGQPVKRGRVRLVRETERRWNWREQKYDTEEAETYEGVLDEQGRFVARVPLAKEHERLADSGWRRFNDLTFAAYVTDPTTNRTEQRRLSVRLTKDPIHLYVSEGRYRQAPGLPLAFYVTTFYADGTPAQCDVDVTGEGRAPARVRTNRFGVAKVTGPAVRKTEGRNNVSLRFMARDREGRTGRHAEDFWLRGDAEDDPPELRVETEKTLYRAGEAVAVRLEASRPLTSVLVDAAGERGVVFSRAVKMTGGRGSLVIPFSEEFRNGVRITAASAEPFGDGGFYDDDDYAFGTRTVVYPRNRELKLDADFSQKSYHPGDEAEVKFDVRSPDGRRAESALGVVVFDKAVEERARTDAEFSRGFGFSDSLYAFWYGPAQVAGVTRRDIEQLDLSRRVPEGMDAVAELAYNDDRPEDSRRTFSLTRFEHDPRGLFLPLAGEQLLPVKAALERSYEARAVYPSDEAALARLLSESGVDLGAISDPWGQPYRTRFYTSGQHDRLDIVSSGADERAGTEDDFTASQLSWPYFRPHGQRMDRAAADYHARTGGFVRDAETLRSELLRHGLDLDSLRDPWGRPYAFDFDVRESNYLITARSAGPDKTLRPKGTPGSDDFEVWTTSLDYFAESRAAIDRALQDVAGAGSAFPETEKALAETLSRAGVDVEKVRDGWGRAAYATFRKQTRDSARLSLETRASFGGGPPQSHGELRPFRQTVYFVELRSAGGDGRPGTADDFDLGRFASLAAERPAPEAARKQARPAVTFTGATGAISGTVTDPQGAAVPDAPVKATHKQTGVEFEAKTGDDGVYLLRD